MSMKALNQLVARSIIDPGVVEAFSSGQIDAVISDLDFSPGMRSHLAEIEAGSWTEYAVLAYRAVKAAEMPVARIELPSPLAGLLPENDRSDEEQVA
jgi:hypothetical protein